MKTYLLILLFLCVFNLNNLYGNVRGGGFSGGNPKMLLRAIEQNLHDLLSIPKEGEWVEYKINYDLKLVYIGLIKNLLL